MFNSKVDRVFGGKVDQFLLSKGGEIIRDSKTVIEFVEYESDYLREFTQGGESHKKTTNWNAFSFGHGALKIRTNGKGAAILYTKTEEIPLTVEELQSELDEYLALFDDEIKSHIKKLEAEEAKREAWRDWDKTGRSAFVKAIQSKFPFETEFNGEKYQLVIGDGLYGPTIIFEKWQEISWKPGEYCFQKKYTTELEIPDNPFKIHNGDFSFDGFSIFGFKTYQDLYDFLLK